MLRRIALSAAVFVFLLGGLFGVLGTAQLSLSVDDADPTVRKAVSNIITARCLDDGSVGPFGYDRTNGVNGFGTTEARSAGLECQVIDMLSGDGDPLITDSTGALVNATADPQAYADGSVAEDNPSVFAERRLARANAAIRAIRDGFAIVPGGPNEAYSRIQSCLNGQLASNQSGASGQPAVNGAEIDCSEDVIREAVALQIAAGFYFQFGNLVNHTCQTSLDQAQNGATSAARYAGAIHYVGDPSCNANLDALAADTSHFELSFTAVGPLAAAGGGSGGSALASALALGLSEIGAVGLDATGNLSTPTLGNLFKYSLARFDTDEAAAIIPPLVIGFGVPNDEARVCLREESGSSSAETCFLVRL